MSNTRSRRLQTRPTMGFTLLEILVVLVIIGMIAGGMALLGLGDVAPESFMDHFTVFVLA